MGRLTLAAALVAGLVAGPAACHDHTEGNAVEVTVQGEGPGDAWVTVDSVELLTCATPAWVPRLVRTAHAHGEDSATKLGTTTVLKLDGGSAEFGTLKPAEGDYCSVRVGFAPADDDAEQLGDTGMVGLTFKFGAVTGADTVSAVADLPATLELSDGEARQLSVTVSVGQAPDSPAAAREALRTGVSASAQ